MRRLLLFLVFSIVLFNSCREGNQRQKDAYEAKTTQEEEVAPVENSSDNLEKRKVITSPSHFDQYDEIEIVFYPTSERAMGLPVVVCNELFKDDIFVIDSIKTRTTLSDVEEEKLAKLLATTSVKVGEEKSEVSTADCYKPKHAVLFYKDGKVVSFVEICFQCLNYCSDAQNNYEIEGKYKELELFFGGISPDLVEKNKE